MRARGKGTRKESPVVWYGKVSAGKVGSREGTYNGADNKQTPPQSTDNRQQSPRRIQRETEGEGAQVEAAVPLPSLLAPDDAAVSTDGTGLLDFWILDSGLWADPRWTEGATNSRCTSRYGDMYPTTSSGRRKTTRSRSTAARRILGLCRISSGRTNWVSEYLMGSMAKPKQHQSLFF